MEKRSKWLLYVVVLNAFLLSGGILGAQEPPEFVEPPMEEVEPVPTPTAAAAPAAVIDGTQEIYENWLQVNSSNWTCTRGKVYVGTGFSGGPRGPGFYGQAEVNLSGSSGRKVNFLDGFNKYITADANNLQIVNIESGDWNTVTTVMVDTGSDSRFRVTSHGGTEHFTVKGRNGYVGLGTTAPSERLQVEGNIKLSGNLVSDGDICIGQCSGQ